MVRMNIFLTVILLVLLASCGNSSQKEKGELSSVIGDRRDTVFIEKHDTIYVNKDSTEAINEQDNAAVISRTFDVGRFSSIRACGALEISFVESEQYSVEVTGTGRQLNNLVCETKNGLLLISSKPSAKESIINTEDGVIIGDVTNNSTIVIGDGNHVVNGGDKTTTKTNSTPIRIVVKGKLSDMLKLSGGCHFTTNSIEVSRNFDIDISSSSKARIGKVACQNLDVEGSSAAVLQISTVIAKHIDIDASSAAVLTMTVECENLEIEASSASICNISGRTNTVKMEKSSAAAINSTGLKCKHETTEMRDD